MAINAAELLLQSLISTERHSEYNLIRAAAAIHPCPTERNEVGKLSVSRLPLTSSKTEARMPDHRSNESKPTNNIRWVPHTS